MTEKRPNEVFVFDIQAYMTRLADHNGVSSGDRIVTQNRSRSEQETVTLYIFSVSSMFCKAFYNVMQ